MSKAIKFRGVEISDEVYNAWISDPETKWMLYTTHDDIGYQLCVDQGRLVWSQYPHLPPNSSRVNFDTKTEANETFKILETKEIPYLRLGEIFA